MTDPCHSKPARLDRPPVVWLHALALIVLGAAVLALPFVVLMRGARPPSIDFTWDFSVGLGFGAMALAVMQFALTGRLRWLTHPFGADIVYLFHRYLSWAALALMLAHFGIFYIWHQPALGVLNPFAARWELTAGRVALGSFLLLVLTAQFRKPLRLPYEHWRALHLSLAIIGTLAAVAHILGVGRFTADPEKRALWLGVTAGWLVLLVWTRAAVPLWQARNPWRVVANRDEGGGVRTLELAPEGQALKRWKPGQFAWLAVDRAPWSLKEHPFTISTAPEKGPNLAFSIKPLGDDTARLVQTRPGTRAYVHGPYGAFSVDRAPGAGGFVMIAGGVGITPLLANLHALQARSDPRPVVLLYANARADDIAFHAELDAMRDDLDLTLVHVLEEPPDGWDGATGRIDRALLERCMPSESRNWPHMLCGPAPMTAAVTEALRGLGVPARHIDSEIFELA
ncbi:MAG: ferredoxin reductase family protein [Rhodobacteraceae bacterium]|nr:ferredoxin reductase family protein [Paracoccaceae bacterium]